MTLLYEMCDSDQSVTDTSEDSVEVRVKPVTATPPSAKKNKRKSMEPKRLQTGVEGGVGGGESKRCRLNSTGSEEGGLTSSPPVSSRSPSPGPAPAPASAPAPVCLAPKKRFKLDALRELERSAVAAREAEQQKQRAVSPFRPWSEAGGGPAEAAGGGAAQPGREGGPTSSVPASYLPFLLPGLVPGTDPAAAAAQMSLLYPYHLLPPYLAGLPGRPAPAPRPASPAPAPATSPATPYHAPVQDEPLSLVMKDKKEQKKDVKPQVKKEVKVEKVESKVKSPAKPTSVPAPVFNMEALMSSAMAGKLNMSGLPAPAKRLLSPEEAAPRVRNDSGSTSSSGEERGKQRNYKNMTRERRVEANARERQRVHTITAAFDNLQAAIPTEEENSKLSKLSVIKIATAYIMALSRMAGHDYTEDQSAPPVEEVITHCSQVIETECRIKKRNSSN